ncbi:MAG: nitronate monooxygenase [Anaerolineae bacterium]
MTPRSNAVPDTGGLPLLIQGGMGVGVSGWRLAQAVGRAGQMGVVSGTALDAVFARRLQLGDPGGDMRRALDSHPWPAMAERVWRRWWRREGLDESRAFAATPMPAVPLTPEHIDLLVTSAFCEIALARQGHEAPVGINLLEKVQLPTLAILLGAILAGVGAVLMGGGIPLSIPGILDRLAAGQAVEQRIDVANLAQGEVVLQTLDPEEIAEAPLTGLVRPLFLGIVSTDGVAKALLRRASGTVDGFIVEHHRAGGHNAPPRRAAASGESAGPAYGPKDEANLEAIQALERPYWLAGGISSPESVQQALASGAHGVQVGTAFAACEESGFAPGIKHSLNRHALSGELCVSTDFRASPTGYPFKISNLPEARAGYADIDARPRVCDLGYLRTVYRNEDGTVDYRCPADRMERFLAAGGSPEEIQGRRCLCNGLLAAIGLGQRRGQAGVEQPIVTLGEDWSALAVLAGRHGLSYSAADVVRYLLGS